jgi:hypothetical protein
VNEESDLRRQCSIAPHLRRRPKLSIWFFGAAQDDLLSQISGCFDAQAASINRVNSKNQRSINIGKTAFEQLVQMPAAQATLAGGLRQAQAERGLYWKGLD